MIDKTISNDQTAAREGLDLLDDLIAVEYFALKEQIKHDAKLGDFLKMLELRRKLAPENLEKKELWNLLRKIRNESIKDHPLTDPKSHPTQNNEEATDDSSNNSFSLGEKLRFAKGEEAK